MDAGMAVVIAMLRGVNLGPHNRVKMEELRALCEPLKFRDAQTYVQSGNVLFRADERDLLKVAKRLEDAIEKKLKFRCDVIARTTAEMREVVAKNPVSKRRGINPSRLLVTFLSADPGDEPRAKLRAIKTAPEELWIDGREVFIYFPNGMARPKLSWPTIPKMLNVSGTARNWNSVVKMLEMAEKMETGE
jgi:uncharacterized protein (DUF1697 family)